MQCKDTLSVGRRRVTGRRGQACGCNLRCRCHKFRTWVIANKSRTASANLLLVSLLIGLQLLCNVSALLLGIYKYATTRSVWRQRSNILAKSLGKINKIFELCNTWLKLKKTINKILKCTNTLMMVYLKNNYCFMIKNFARCLNDSEIKRLLTFLTYMQKQTFKRIHCQHFKQTRPAPSVDTKTTLYLRYFYMWNLFNL